jgi:hypothetical protein
VEESGNAHPPTLIPNSPEPGLPYTLYTNLHERDVHSFPNDDIGEVDVVFIDLKKEELRG